MDLITLTAAGPQRWNASLRRHGVARAPANWATTSSMPAMPNGVVSMTECRFIRVKKPSGPSLETFDPPHVTDTPIAIRLIMLAFVVAGAAAATVGLRVPPADQRRWARLTSAVAYALSQLIDSRIGEHQARVLEGAQALSPEELETLDEVELTGLEPGPPPGAVPPTAGGASTPDDGEQR